MRSSKLFKTITECTRSGPRITPAIEVQIGKLKRVQSWTYLQQPCHLQTAEVTGEGTERSHSASRSYATSTTSRYRSEFMLSRWRRPFFFNSFVLIKLSGDWTGVCGGFCIDRWAASLVRMLSGWAYRSLQSHKASTLHWPYQRTTGVGGTRTNHFECVGLGYCWTVENEKLQFKGGILDELLRKEILLSTIHFWTTH